MSAILTVIISVLLSLLATLFSYQRFLREKWSEYKIKSYEKIIESLYHIKKYIDTANTYHQYEAEEEHDDRCRNEQFSKSEYEKYQKINEPARKNRIAHQKQIIEFLWKKHRQSLEEIDRLIDVSEYISEEAIKTLTNFKEEWGKEVEDEETEDAYNRLLLVCDCLSSFKENRKEDLLTMSYFASLKNEVFAVFKNFWR